MTGSLKSFSRMKYSVTEMTSTTHVTILDGSVITSDKHDMQQGMKYNCSRNVKPAAVDCSCTPNVT